MVLAGPRWLARALIPVVLAVGAPACWLMGPTEPTDARPTVGIAEWLADPRRPPHPVLATPAEVAAYFARTPPGDGAALARGYPQIVGNLDGAPVPLRYLANAVQAPQWAGRQVLAFDGRGDGHVAEVLGDLPAAERVVVLVPGVDSSLVNFDTGHGGRQRRALAWQARQLMDQIRGLDAGARVAVVAWLGYDPPEGVRRDALREDRAAAGALALDRLVDGLVLARPRLAVTIVGHSYGSTVAGLAARDLSPQVTDIVSIGSPGMGVPDRSALRTQARVWAGSAPNDWTRRVLGVRVFGVGHGRLPVDRAFGALPLPCEDVDGHDGYFLAGTSALLAMAQIGLGRAAHG
ncbi:MAG TPA: alpha/beta hydrolase [Pilimelia sp.]|nr:alpha/beta hydrolase [Pilimelia sp.]